jgi:hypothetical protein
VRLTQRDARLIRDVALSHVLSRDQILHLGYFTSVTRVNTRLRELGRLGLAKRLNTPFFAQSLFTTGSKAPDVAGERVRALLAGRSETPRFLQHALSVTNARIRLLALGAVGWRFEQQLWHWFEVNGRRSEVRPDGLAVFEKRLVAVEVDMGHVAPAKFGEKLQTYADFLASGECHRAWGQDTASLLILVPGERRVRSLTRQCGPHSFEWRCHTFAEFGMQEVSGWS